MTPEYIATAKKRFVIVVILGLVAFAMYGLYSYSFIEVTVSSPGDGPLTLSLLRQGSEDANLSETSGRSTVKRLVRRGNHEVLVQQNETSYFTVTKTGGFLSTTKVTAKLSPESSRLYIGNNPGPCMNYINNVLVSYGCNDSFNNINIHVPANASQPTHAQKNQSVLEGSLQGIVTTTEGIVTLIRAPAISEDQGPPQTAYLLNNDLGASGGIAMDELRDDTLYAITAYRDGFVAYDRASWQISYYSSRGAEAVKIPLERPEDEALLPYELDISDNAIAVSYSNNTQGEVADIHDPNNSKVLTEVALFEDGKTTFYSFRGQYGQFKLCGTDKLCMLKDRLLEIYDVSNDKEELLFAVSGVEWLEYSGDSLVVVKDRNVLGIDIDNRSGHIQYSLGEHNICAVQGVVGGSYILCAINSNMKKVALLVNPAQPNQDSIDKKIDQLIKSPAVKDVSIYGRFIYVSPELGEIVYIPEEDSFGYPESTRKRVTGIIGQEIDKLGIDKSAYTIINTLN